MLIQRIEASFTNFKIYAIEFWIALFEVPEDHILFLINLCHSFKL